MSRQIVLFGGTFDPVHFGHLITARSVAEQCGFEQITLVPASSPPHKDQARAPKEHRLAMLQLAVGDDPLFDICTLELDMSGPSYTFQTLQALRHQHGQGVRLCLVIAADMLAGLPDWHRAREVVDMAQIIVASRPPWQGRMEELLTDLVERFGQERLQRIRDGLVSTPLIDISSTDIRRRVAEGRSLRYITPDSVRVYIETHCLYRSDPPQK